MQLATGTDFRGALRLLADRYGVPMEDRPLSPADYRAWAQRRARDQRDLPDAESWRRAALCLIDELLVGARPRCLHLTVLG